MHSQMFFKIIANFTGKHLCRSLLLWSCRHQKCNFIKKRPQHRIFPVKFAKFLRAPCLTEHLQWLLLKVSGFEPATLLKKRLRKRYFSVNFAKFLKHIFFWQDTSGWLLFVFVFLRFCVWVLRSFSEHYSVLSFFYRAPQGNCYFMYKLQNFNHQIQ